MVQGGGGGYRAHTVKNWCIERKCGTQGRERSEGHPRSKRKKGLVTRKNTEKAGRKKTKKK